MEHSLFQKTRLKNRSEPVYLPTAQMLYRDIRLIMVAAFLVGLVTLDLTAPYGFHDLAGFLFMAGWGTFRNVLVAGGIGLILYFGYVLVKLHRLEHGLTRSLLGDVLKRTLWKS
ncbi:hypothetical protein QQM79_15850 [Marinobacteraceae bacterium S3BR75-40.1]